MFFYKKENNKIIFEMNGTDYMISNMSVKKYNYNKRDKNDIVIKEKIEKEELERLVISLVNIIYKQNKIFAKNIIRGV